MLQNDSGKTIRDVNSAYSGDFSSGAGTINNGPFLSAQQFIISTTGVSVSSGTSYSGTVTITYKRNGVNFVSSAVCTGVA